MKKLFCACLLITPFLSASAFAAIITYQFNGVVTAVAPALDGGFDIDEILVGRFNVDTTGSQQSSRTIYQASNLSIEIGGDYVVTGASGSMIITNDSNLGGSLLDGVTVSFSNSSAPNVFGAPVNGDSPGYFDIQLDWFTNGPLSSQDLPTFIPVNTGEYDRSNINFPSDSERLSYELTSMTVVPIPAAIWLFGSGLIGLVGFAKRKKA